MKRKISIMVLLLIILITLSGCVKVEYSTTINKDDSGEITYLYAMDKAVMKNLGESSIDSAREKAENSGYIIENYEDDKSSGFLATKKVDNITDKSYIKEVFDEYIKNDEESKINIKRNLFGKTYSQNVSVDTKSIESLKELGAKVQYTVKLPVRVGKSNANTISKDKKTLTWELDLGQNQEIYFKATSGHVLLIICIITLVLIVAALVYIFVFKKHKIIGKEKNNKGKQSKSK